MVPACKSQKLMIWRTVNVRTVVEGDAKETVPTLGQFDRIIMPLPKQADMFLDVAFPALKKGGMIHFYVFAHNSLEATGHLAETAAILGRRISVVEAVECGSYSPCLSRYCVDFRLA